MRFDLISGLTALVVVVTAARSPAADKPALLDEPALAARIDALLAARQKAKGVPPAPRNDDAAFIRGAYLDLAGCIPPLIDVRDFLNDPRPDKRRAWVDALLAGRKPAGKPDAYPRHLATVLRSWVLSRTNSDDAAVLARPVEAWLFERLKKGMGYDKLVREMIATSPAVGGKIKPYGLSANLFYQANEFKPENLAASTARLFLGVTLECAQCHDDRSGGGWKQGEFWSLAAFYGGVDPVALRVSDRREIELPGSKGVARARFLAGGEPAWAPAADPRAVLADWVTGPDNPYFARAAANRVWWHLFGTGLTDPVDSRGDHNPPSHPELLDELARQFAGHGHDLAYLIRAITCTDAYQRSSASTHPGQNDPRLFARKAVRGLSPEQLFDSLAEATDFRGVGTGPGERDPDPGALTPRQQFVGRFAHPGGAAASTSVPQALYMMNGPFVSGRTSRKHNGTLAAVIDDHRGGTSRQVETLFLVTLSRKPTAQESKRFVGFVEGGLAADRGDAMADVFWVLINGAEFCLNH
jgi:hypothetical protein